MQTPSGYLVEWENVKLEKILKMSVHSVVLKESAS